MITVLANICPSVQMPLLVFFLSLFRFSALAVATALIVIGCCRSAASSKKQLKIRESDLAKTGYVVHCRAREYEMLFQQSDYTQLIEERQQE